MIYRLLRTIQNVSFPISQRFEKKEGQKICKTSKMWAYLQKIAEFCGKKLLF